MKSIYAVALALFCSFSHANVILEVDLSDPTAATFNSTSAFADATLADTVFNGITLTGFFSGNTTAVNFLNVDAGSLNVFNAADASTRFALFSWFVGTFVGGWTANDLNFFNNVTADPLHMFDDQVALTGSATLDLSSLLGLPAVGSSGNVVIGEPNSGLVVGQWEITGRESEVPAPASFLLLGLGLLILGCSRRSEV